MVRSVLLGLAVLSIVACGTPEEGGVAVSDSAARYEASDTIVVTGSRQTSDAPAPYVSSENQPEGGQLLAYSYGLRLELPAIVVTDVMMSHRDACQSAGPSVCQVLSASVDGYDPDAPSAELRLRAIPTFIADFQAGLEGELDASGGRIIEESQDIEDLTSQIFDTRTRLEAQKTLRDRLLSLLERQTDDVGDLLQVERELARVQAEIESMTGQLAYLEGRVSMNLMQVSYQPEPEVFTRQKAQPLRDAIAGFFATLAWSLGELIRFTAMALPWTLIGLPALWILIRLLKVWRR